jgi:flavin reductase (DIM6/NTAB) family NADH-FMN oxidoreductase RutF
MQQYDSATIRGWERFYRGHFINSLSGFKSASLIGTVSTEGIPNLAIFSNIVHIGADPALVGFINRPVEAAPHTLENIKFTGVYTINHIHKGIVEQAHQTSAKYSADTDEFTATGLSAVYRENCRAPFVAESRVQYSLQLQEIIPITLNHTFLVIGEVQHVYLQDGLLQADGFIAADRAGSIASLGMDGYYSCEQINRYAYAKPGLPPQPLIS